MANLKEIRNRISSVKSTRKITSAMSRIAAARLRKAQTAMENARHYGTRMATIVSEILRELDQLAGPTALHPLLRAHDDTGPVAFLVVTADRGLCGGFNSGVNRQVEREIKALRKQGREVSVITIGRKGRDYLKSYKQGFLAHHPAPAGPDAIVDVAKAAALQVMALFQAPAAPTPPGSSEPPSMPVGEVRLVFNYFRNVITQEVHSDRLLPVPIPGPVESEAAQDHAPGQPRAATVHAIRMFEPDTKQLLDHLLPVAVETAIQQALYNSVAAEVAARRTAMDSATDNATELISELTLQYNRERQAAITKELMEIIGGSEALRG